MNNIRDYIIDSIINQDNIILVNENNKNIGNIINNVCDEMLKTVHYVKSTGENINSDIIVFNNVDSHNELIRDIAGALNNNNTIVINIVNDMSIVNTMHPAISSKFVNKFIV